MEEVVERILKDDLVIAVLTFARHNVYYELGIAHAAGRNVILLLSDAEDDVPFDIRQMKHIRYSYDPVKLRDGVAARSLANHILKHYRKNETYSHPFGQKATDYKAFGGEHAHLNFYPEFKALPLPGLLNLYREAENFIAVLEPGLEVMRSLPESTYQDLIKILQRKAIEGCRINLLYSKKPGKDGDEGELKKQDDFIARVRRDLSTTSSIRFLEVAADFGRDRYIVTDKRALIVRGSSEIPAIGSCPAIAVSSVKTSEFARLYQATRNDIQALVRRGGGHLLDQEFDEDHFDPRLEVFKQARAVVERAKDIVIVLEPSFALCSPVPIEGEDEFLAHWRQGLVNLIVSKAPKVKVALVSYDITNPFFVDEMRRLQVGMSDEHAIEFASRAQTEWRTLKEQAQEGAPHHRFVVKTASRSVIAERVIFTENEMFSVSLCSRVGHEACISFSRPKGSAEYERFLSHVYAIIAYDATSTEADDLFGTNKSTR